MWTVSAAVRRISVEGPYDRCVASSHGARFNASSLLPGIAKAGRKAFPMPDDSIPAARERPSRRAYRDGHAINADTRSQERSGKTMTQMLDKRFSAHGSKHHRSPHRAQHLKDNSWQARSEVASRPWMLARTPVDRLVWRACSILMRDPFLRPTRKGRSCR